MEGNAFVATSAVLAATCDYFNNKNVILQLLAGFNADFIVNFMKLYFSNKIS